LFRGPAAGEPTPDRLPRARRAKATTTSDPHPVETPADRPWWRAGWLHVALLVLVTCAHWAPRLRGPIDLRYDAGVYYALGTSLAEGRGYRILSEPGEIEGVQYPPALPALVALHQLALGTADPLVVGPALRITSFALALAYALACYGLARALVASVPAFLAALVTSIAFHTIHLSDLCFTEVPFALVSVLFALSLRARWTRWLTPFLAALAFLLRTAGLALLGAWVLEAAWRRDLRAVVLRALASAVPFLAWQAHVAAVRGAPEYEHPAYAYQRAPYLFYNVTYAENVALLDPFRPELGELGAADLARRLAGNVARVPLVLGESVSTLRGFWRWGLRWLGERLGLPVPEALAWLAIAPLGALVLAGLVLLWRAGERFHVLYVACSLALILATPWPAQFGRYLAPLTPFLTVALAAAVARLTEARRAFALTWVAVLLAQAFALRQTFAMYHRELAPFARDEASAAAKLFVFDDAAPWRAFVEALDWIEREVGDEAVFATAAPHLLWLATGNQAVMPPFEDDPAEAQRLLDVVPVDYLVLDAFTFVDVGRRYAAPVVAAYPERWELAYRDERGLLEIYRAR
jgi:hypothetical protein